MGESECQLLFGLRSFIIITITIDPLIPRQANHSDWLMPYRDVFLFCWQQPGCQREGQADTYYVRQNFPLNVLSCTCRPSVEAERHPR